MIYETNKLFKNEKSLFISIITFIGCFYLLAGYRNNSGLSNDVSNGGYEYYAIEKNNASSYEIGYVLLMKLGQLFNYSYFDWRRLVFFISLFIIFLCIYYFSDNPHIIYSLFSAYLIILSAEQIRNTIALSFFLVGLFTYLFTKIKEKRIIYVIFTILAGLIHSMFFLYLFLLFLDITFSEKNVKRIAAVVCLFCIVIFLNNNTIPGFNAIISHISNERADNYFIHKTRYGFLYPMVLHLSSVMLTYIASKNSSNEAIYKIHKLNLITMIWFPLFMINLSFYRISRNILLITYFAQADILSDDRILLKKKAYSLLLLIISVLLWIYIDLFITTPPEALLIPFFEDNVLFLA